MAVSVFDLFKIGIGPSSSHTVGPMRAARLFVESLLQNKDIKITHIKAELFGSLGATGKGHGTDKAIMLGFLGETPDKVDTDAIDGYLEIIRNDKQINLLGKEFVSFNPEKDLVFRRNKSLPYHSNGMRFHAYDENDQIVFERQYYSIGGGFIVDESAVGADRITEDKTPLPYAFSTCKDLLKLCAENDMSISQVMYKNEQSWRSENEIHTSLLNIWKVMQDCVSRGCASEGILPGGMKVKRRAAGLNQQLGGEAELNSDPMIMMDWVNLFAIAVNEENAAGGRVVTAPTNGAAGIIPAVLHYYWKFCPSYSEEGIVRFLLTAGAIGVLYKENASISGAEVGCQGEVGSACSMAAAGLTEILGGTPEQVENAAEIGMEHNLGLTCDPVGGLVQVPCIERNAMGAIKAINASRMAMRGDGKHYVSLDKVIKTMRDTGADMKTKYKETARGGLAVNVVEC
jgi:L-serine dehydratase